MAYRIPSRNVEYWTAKFASNMERDQRTLEKLESLGYMVIVCWECDIKTGVNAVVDRICETLQDRGWRQLEKNNSPQ